MKMVMPETAEELEATVFCGGGDGGDGGNEETDEDGCPDYDPPVDPEPEPDGPSSPSSA